MRTCPECSNSYDDEVLHCPEDGVDLTHEELVDELIGRTIGSYKIVKPLGKGGMGAVYLGEHPVIGSRVAIKFLHPQYATDKKIVDRFFNEARAVNLIGHDNILKILDLNVSDDNRHYFIMEFLKGKALQDFVRPDAPMPLSEAGPILVQICAALQAAHDKGIIHRDLKPDNVYLIAHNGRKHFVKVVDFGIAKLTDSGAGGSTNKTQTGVVMGTPAYMSPEQGAGEVSRIDGRSDIYSLGVMMFQMATGVLPFPGKNFGEVLMGHLQRPPPPPRSLVPEIPEDYEAVLLKCLEKDQEARYQNMNDLREAIFACMDAHGISAELPLADAEEAQPAGQPGATSNPGLRTPAKRTDPRSSGGAPRQVSSPRGQVPPGLRVSNPRAAGPSSQPRGPGQKPSPGRSRSQPPAEQTVAHAPPSRLPLILGGAVAALLVLGGIGWVATSGSSAKQVQAEQAAQAAARAAASVREKTDSLATVQLVAESDPGGSQVKATWQGGEKSGAAPIVLDLPRNARVRIDFAKADCAPYTMEVVADVARTETAKLSCPQHVVEAPPPATAVAESSAVPTGEPKKPRKKSESRKANDPPAQKDGLIDLGDAFK